METVIAQSEYELERGKPMPSYLHGHLQGLLTHLFFRDHRGRFSIITELSISISGNTKVPDIAIYAKRPVNFSQDEIKMTEPPLCAIEILSPTQSLTELTSKCKEYFDMGVKSYWLILPTLQSIYLFTSPTEHTAFTNGQTLTDEILNIELSLIELFEET